MTLSSLRAYFILCLSLTAALLARADNESAPSNAIPHINIAILGDSMSWIGGENCQNPKGWTHYFKKCVNPGSIFIYARSGATWSNDSVTTFNPDAYSEVIDSDNVVYNQVVRLKRDLQQNRLCSPDLIIMFAGANDAWFESSRPGCLNATHTTPVSINPADLPSLHTSMAESIGLCVNMIREFLPQTRIALVTPLENAKTSPEKTMQVASIIQNAARELGCDLIDATQQVDIRHSREAQHRLYTSDGVHTNPQGAELIARVMCDYALSLIKK